MVLLLKFSCFGNNFNKDNIYIYVCVCVCVYSNTINNTIKNVKK